MTGSFFHQGWEADEDPPKPKEDVLELTDVTSFPEGGLAPAIEHRLEELNVPIPQEIDLGTVVPEPIPGEAATVAKPVESFFETPLGETYEPTGNPKDLLGVKKPDLSLVPPAAGLYTALAFADGAAKYGPYNWRENPVKARVYIAAALRHIGQYLDGENIDPVSGVPHLGHALACFSILADAEELGNLIDDRPVRGPAGDLIRRLTKD